MNDGAWHGTLPPDWLERPLYAVATERRIGNKGLRETNLLSLSYGRIVRKDIKSSEGLLPASFETYQIVEPGDVVLRLTDLQNDQRSLRSGLVAEKGIITSAYLALRVRGAEPRFIAYQLRAIDSMKIFYSMGGGLRQSIGYDDLKRLPLALPPIEEQRAIADYLDRETAQIDAFIAKNEELIDLLVERRAAVVTALIVGGLNPKAVTVDVPGIGRLPAHWIVDRFARVAQVRGGLLAPNDQRFETLPLVAPNHVESGTGRLLALIPASEQSAESGKYAVRAGDVIYSKIRPVLAKVVLAPEDCLCSADMYAITSRSSGALSNEFLRWQLLSKWFTEWATERSMRVAMPKINQDTLAGAPLVLPPIDEQREIVERVNQETAQIDRAIAAARNVVQLARERRASLISAAVTGKIDVGVAA